MSINSKMKKIVSVVFFSFLIIFVALYSLYEESIAISSAVIDSSGNIPPAATSNTNTDTNTNSDVLGQPAQQITQSSRLSLGKAREQMFFTAFPIALALLHFFLFVFYPFVLELGIL